MMSMNLDLNPKIHGPWVTTSGLRAGPIWPYSEHVLNVWKCSLIPLIFETNRISTKLFSPNVKSMAPGSGLSVSDPSLRPTWLYCKYRPWNVTTPPKRFVSHWFRANRSSFHANRSAFRARLDHSAFLADRSAFRASCAKLFVQESFRVRSFSCRRIVQTTPLETWRGIDNFQITSMYIFLFFSYLQCSHSFNN